jgi:hypothetical protein
LLSCAFGGVVFNSARKLFVRDEMLFIFAFWLGLNRNVVHIGDDTPTFLLLSTSENERATTTSAINPPRI